jgi:PAS domain-containing protein
MEAYIGYYCTVNPLLEPLARLPAGSVISDRALIPHDAMTNTEYFADYGREFDMGGSATMVLGKDGPHQSCLGILHGWRAEPFSTAQLELLSSLTRCFQSAVAISRRFELLRAENLTQDGTLDSIGTGILLLDERGALIRANAAAEDLLRREDGLRTQAGKLYSADPRVEAVLESTIHCALTGTGGRGGFFNARRGEGLLPLSVRVAHLPRDHTLQLDGEAPRAIVFIGDPGGRQV